MGCVWSTPTPILRSCNIEGGFRKRKGLQKLIQDVIQGQASYRAILVYDVSRWGRFQDTDETAYYEFLCKSAGVPAHLLR